MGDAAAEHRQLIADEFAAAVGQDGRAAGQACLLLLAGLGVTALPTREDQAMLIAMCLAC